MGTLLKYRVLNIRTASSVSGSFFVVVVASEVNGIDDVVDDTVDEIVVVGIVVDEIVVDEIVVDEIVVDGIVIDALAFVK